jgi:GTP-binding protein
MTTDDYIKYLSKTLPNLDFVPISFISAKTGFNIWENVRLSKELYKQSNTKLQTSVINKALKRVREAQSPTTKSATIPRIYYATQTGTNPPEITMFVNEPALFGPSYQKFVLNRLRHELSFSEIPLRLNLRKRQRAK